MADMNQEEISKMDEKSLREEVINIDKIISDFKSTSGDDRNVKEYRDAKKAKSRILTRLNVLQKEAQNG